MQHLKKILRLSVIQIWTKIESFIYQKFWKNWSLWFSPQKMCKFLSNSVHFLDNHSRYAQNDSFTLGSTSFLKKSRIFRSLGGSCEKWQPISRRMSWFNPPPPLLGLNVFHPAMDIVAMVLYTFSKALQNLGQKLKWIFAYSKMASHSEIIQRIIKEQIESHVASER